MPRRLIALILAAAIEACFVPGARAHEPTGHLVLGYYVPYDGTSWASLEANIDTLDVVAVQNVSIDTCGGLTSRDDLSLEQFAHAHGVQVEPSLFTVSAGLDHQVLTDDQARATALQSIVSYTTELGYDGFDLDMEGIDPADRQAYTDFVSDLASALHQQSKQLSLAVPAKERETTAGWAGAFDYAALGAQADLITVMAYEYRGPFSGPGSVAPYDWVSRVASYATRQMPAGKVLLGLAAYGYDWNTTSGGTVSVGWPRAMAIAEHAQAILVFDANQQSLTFGYTADPGDRPPPAPVAAPPAHTLTLRAAPACGAEAPATPPPTATPRPAPDVPQDHQVWVEDSASAAARLNVALADGAGGVSMWRLGLEDPGAWPLFQQWRARRSADEPA